MKIYRKTHDLDLKVMAKVAGVTTGLLDILESGGVTHPKLAEKVGRTYGLTPLETEELMPENHRKHSPNYDPDRYKIEPVYNDRILPRREFMDIYVMERRNEQMTGNARRNRYEA